MFTQIFHNKGFGSALGFLRAVYSDWTWIIISEIEMQGKYMGVSVLSLCCLSFLFVVPWVPAPAADQRLTLIQSEWSRRGEGALWLLNMTYQFQSLYNTRLSQASCIMHWLGSPGIQSHRFIDHEGYPCIFHEGDGILWSKVLGLRSADCLERSGLEEWLGRAPAALALKAVQHCFYKYHFP